MSRIRNTGSFRTMLSIFFVLLRVQGPARGLHAHGARQQTYRGGGPGRRRSRERLLREYNSKPLPLQTVVLWNSTNDLLRFRFRLWKSLGGGSG
jgi:hypothetical protein